MIRIAWQSASWLTLFFVLACALLLLFSFALSGVAGLIPRVVSSLTLGLLLIQLLREIGEGSTEAAAAAIHRLDRSKQVSVFHCVLWLAILAASVWTAGLIAGAAVFCAAFLRWYSRRTWAFCIGYSATLAVLLAAVFQGLLRVHVYQGMFTFP